MVRAYGQLRSIPLQALLLALGDQLEQVRVGALEPFGIEWLCLNAARRTIGTCRCAGAAGKAGMD